MSIVTNDPKAQALIQSGHLELGFKEALEGKKAYRASTEKKSFATRIGQSTTDTRLGLAAPTDTPQDPAARTGLDDGMTPESLNTESYTMNIDRYGKTFDVETEDSQVSIANQWEATVRVASKNAAQSVERVTRNVFLNTYGVARTFVRTTLGSAGPNLPVDDIRGFEKALKNGKFDPVSGSNTAQVKVGDSTYTLIGVAKDDTNVSLLKYQGDTNNMAGGVSGVLTFLENVSVANGTMGKPVVHANAPSSVRAGGKNTWKDLLKTDKLTATQVLDGVTAVRNNTGMHDETFDMILSSTSMNQLFQDPDFKLSYQGQYGSREMRSGTVFEMYGVRFITTSEAPTIKNGDVTVHSPLIIGPQPLVEGRYAGMDNLAGGSGAVTERLDIEGTGCQLILRAPLNRLGNKPAVTWQFIGGWAAPTDALTDQNIIPSAEPAYLKRAVFLQHGA